MRTGKKVIAVLMSALAVFLLAACAKRTDVDSRDTYIYSLNTDRTGLVKIAFEFGEEDPLAQAEAVLAEMKQPASEIEYTTVFPEDVEVTDCTISGGILAVDFNSAYLQMENVEEKLVRAAVVQSLVRIDGINAVYFSVDGENLKDAAGRVIGLMNEDDFVENTASSPSSYQTGTLNLYFANGAGDKLVEQQVDVRYSSNISREKLIVEKLMQGPQSGDAYPVINPDTNLLSVTIKDRICYVNFDSTFLTGTYDILPELTVYSIVNSLTEGTEAEQVQITINGESDNTYMEAVDLSKPLDANMNWVAAEENET